MKNVQETDFTEAVAQLSIRLQNQPNISLVEILQQADELRSYFHDCIGILLIEHASTVLDEPPLKVRKGGITPLMRSMTKSRLNKGASIEQLISEIRGRYPYAHMLGLDPNLS